MNKPVQLILGNYADEKALTNLIEPRQEPFCTLNRAGTPIGSIWHLLKGQQLSRTRFPWTQNWLNRSVQGGPEHDR